MSGMKTRKKENWAKAGGRKKRKRKKMDENSRREE